MERQIKLGFESTKFKKVITAIRTKNAQPRLIGGCIRDAILKHLNIIKEYPQDIDIATSLTPDKVMQKLEKAGIKAIPTGIEHGTVTAVYEGEAFEITTLRKDVSCNGRHAKVEFTDSFEEDSRRRDFTINALSYCPVKEVMYDYQNGLRDIFSKEVIFIGDPKERIEEDYLRILRYYRFCRMFHKLYDGRVSYRYICRLMRDGLKQISKERIHDELVKLFKSDESSVAMFFDMLDDGIIDAIGMNLPMDYEGQRYAKDYAKYHKVSLPAIIAGLFCRNEGKDVEKMLKSLCFSKAEIKKVLYLLEYAYQIRVIGATANKLAPRAWYEDIVDIHDIGSLGMDYRYKITWSPSERKELQINGMDLAVLGIPERDRGLYLRYFTDQWLRSYDRFIHSKNHFITQVIPKESLGVRKVRNIVIGKKTWLSVIG